LARGQQSGRPDPARLVPPGRSVLLAFAILGGALLVWFGARETGVFGVRTVDVRGASPGIASQVRKTLADERGRSLLKVDLGAAQRAIEALPSVRSASFDRSYPHTLVVAVLPEVPVAVVRQGARSFLVSDRGRVIRAVDRLSRPTLARIWVGKDAELAPGAYATGDLLAGVSAVAPLISSSFPGRVGSVVRRDGELVLRLRGGTEVRLGEPGDISAKLAVAAEVIPQLVEGETYVDVSVPERPVTG
jgi:cell division protein FtsQ